MQKVRKASKLYTGISLLFKNVDYYPLFSNRAFAYRTPGQNTVCLWMLQAHLPRQRWNLRSNTTLKPPLWNISTLQQNEEILKNPGFTEGWEDFCYPLCMFQRQDTLISEQLRREIGFKNQFSLEMPDSVTSGAQYNKLMLIFILKH